MNYQIIINRDNCSGRGAQAMIIAVLIEMHDIILPEYKVAKAGSEFYFTCPQNRITYVAYY